MTNFLQRFKGKTTTLGKDGLVDVIRDTGTKNGGNVIVQTNINFKPRASDPAPIKAQRHLSSEIRQRQQPPEQKKAPPPAATRPPKATTTNKHPPPPQSSGPIQSSPFYVANPFRLDDNQPLQQYNPKPQTTKVLPKNPPIQKPEKQFQKPTSELKQTIKSSTRGQSWDAKKSNSKEWVKLGGLGANIGGEDWQEKKRKLEKMQEFAEQVKMANADKAKDRRLDEEEDRKEKKEKNAREKALEYCKNIPKPPKRPPKKEEELPPQQVVPQPVEPHQLSELQLYERRHQELQKLINKQ